LKAFLPFLTDIDTVHRALAWSAAHGRSKLVKRILEHPDVDVNAKVRGDTALYLACDAVDRDSIVSLLEAEADPTIICSNARDEFSGIGSSFYGHLGISQQDITRGFTAMYAFCNLGRRGPRREKLPPEMIQEVFDLLIAKGASINQRTGDGSTLLHVAVNNPVLTRLLLRAGADPNATDEKGCVPLHSVTYPDSVDLLVEEGQADINAVRPSDGRTPLLCGLGQYDKDVIIKLIAYGPDLSIKDIKGNGPLHVALTQTSTSRTILEALLSAGADPNKRNHDGQTPLLLLRSKLGLMVDVLLKYGADINAKDFAGRTLLCHIMGERMSSDHSDIEALIAKGADPSVSDYKGKTLLHHAVARDDRLHHAMKPRKTATRFDFALSLGLDCQSLDYNGNTLLHEVVLRPGILQSQYTSQHIVLLEQLLALGIDINQGNHRGRTVLHMLAAIPSSNNGSVAEKPGYHDELDLVIGKIKDIDQRDQQGLTALHLASTVSVNLTKRLLDTGADPSVASLDGLTPLHLAARARQSNTVGLLLEANKVQGTSLVNAVDAKGNTPLYYACRSGMGETVRLLLDAGADASSKSLFLACAEFEEEQNLWSQERHVADVQANQGATGLTIEDRTRPSFGVNIHRGYKEIDAFRDLPRIEEILDMLIEHGCHPPGLHSALSKAIEAGFDYTIGCIRRVRDRHHNDEDKKATGDVLNVFDETTSKALERAHIDVATNPSILHSEKANRDLVVRLLKKRQYYTMQPLFDAGVNFVALGGRRYLKSKNLDLFVSHGYVSLLDTIGTLEAKRRLDEGKWHAYGDKSMPGLYSDVDVQDLKPRDMSQDVILIKALHRETPNMDVVRLLVEKFHVDVNQSLYTMHPTNDAKSELVPSETPLHYLAHGYHWWHVALALPYLISKGANLNAKDHTGSTPLHIALGGPGRYFGLFHKEAARFLVLAGADVNAVDGEGQSCLVSAASHLSMVQLLLEHRVSIDASALFVAIDAKNVDVLKALLKAGADPNNRMDVQPKSPEAKADSWRRGFPTALYERVPIQEVYPLYSAAVKHGGRDYWLYADKKTSATAVQLVEALLAAGADPYATFRRKNPNYREENDGKDLEDEAVRGLLSNNSLSTEKSQTVTIIHDLLETNDLVHPILLLPSLDANRRDAQGRTLLHVACHAHELSSPIDSVFKKRQETFSSSLPLFWTCLTARGADALATDSSSRNVLHHMYLNNERGASSDEEISLLKQILVQWPSLINQADTHGKTPLHVAMKHAVLRCDTRPAEALLHAGADPGKVTHDGDTCLHVLAFRIYGSAAVRALFTNLLTRGLDINARNKRGETPIFNLNKNLHNVPMEVKPNERITAAEALSLFENAGADLFARDALGRGLLHVAAKETVVDEYAGLDEDDEEYSARNPIEPCVMRFQVLVQRGLDPMVEDGRKRTAVDVAAAFGKESVLSLFDKDIESVVGGQQVVRKTVK
jgi:ankyrin repeat protein